MAHRITFISKGRDTQVVIKHAEPTYNAGRTTWTGEKIAQFHQGVLHDDVEARRLGISRDELVAGLRRAGIYGEFIFEKGKEPGAPHMSLEEVLSKVAAASAKQDVRRLRELLDEELAEDNREPVVLGIRTALGALGDLEEGKRPPGRPKPSAQVVSEA